MEVFILEVNIWEIPKFCHIIWGIDILFEKLSPEIGGWIWETPFAHYAGLVQSGKVGKSQGKLGNSSGAQGEKYRLKFESQWISNLEYFSFYGFNSFEVFLSFDRGNKN